MEKKMAIGHLPSLTWNRLRMNEAAVDPEWLRMTAKAAVKVSCAEPAVYQDITAKQAAEYLEKYAGVQEPEKYIAGKAPVYHAQRFATGLGAEFQKAMEQENVPVHLLTVPAGTRPAENIRIDCHFPGNENSGEQLLIHIRENASATVLLNETSEGDCRGSAAFMMRILMEPGAKLTLARIQLLGYNMVSMNDLGVSQRENSELVCIPVELGGSENYVGSAVELMEEGAALKVLNGYMGTGSQKLDMNYNIVQRGRKTSCHMSFDGVLEDMAAKCFKGTIDFRNGSSGSVGDEIENVLLLGEKAANRTLPVILCEEEDVEGAHGATIGRLDESILFYMASRGIDEKEAARIMIRARLEAVSREIPDEVLRKQISEYIERKISC